LWPDTLQRSHPNPRLLSNATSTLEREFREADAEN